MLGRILFVCTGNQCRSPAAEMILRHHLGAGSGGYEIWSAGTRAPDGVGIHPLTAQALAHLGVPVRRHASRRITAEDVQGADLVLCATRQHRAEVASLMRGASARTFTICEFARITRAVDGAHDSSLSEMVGAMSRRRVLDQPREPSLDDLADPIGGGPQQHRAAVEILDLKCQEIVHLLMTRGYSVGIPARKHAVSMSAPTRPQVGGTWPSCSGRRGSTLAIESPEASPGDSPSAGTQHS